MSRFTFSVVSKKNEFDPIFILYLYSVLKKYSLTIWNWKSKYKNILYIERIDFRMYNGKHYTKVNLILFIIIT